METKSTSPIKKIETLFQYKVISDESSVFYSTDEPITKKVDGIEFIEVTSSLTSPRIQFIARDSIVKTGKVLFDTRVGKQV